MASIKLNWQWIYWEDGFTWSKNILPQILENGLKEEELNRSVYVIRLNGSFAIKYPDGISSVLYIGEGDFRTRLNNHVKKWLGNLWDIIGNDGLTIGIATPRVRNNLSAYKDVEAKLIDEFLRLYGTAPLNNKQYEYSKIEHDYDMCDINSALKIGRGIRHKWAVSPMKANDFYQCYHQTHI